MNFTCTFSALNCVTNDKMSRLLLVVGFSPATKTQMQLFTRISRLAKKKKKNPTNYRLESDDDENKRGGLNIDAA